MMIFNRRCLIFGAGRALRLMFLIAPLQTPISSAAVNNNSAASPRILLPRDVYFDRETREQLDLISESYAQEDEGSQVVAHDKISAALRTLSSSGNADQVTLTMTGYKGGRLEDQINQDRALIVNPLLLPHRQNEEQQDNHVSPSLLMGVLDGHGDPGHRVSEFARIQLEQRLTATLQRDLAVDHHNTNAAAAAAAAAAATKATSTSSPLLKNTTYISNLVTQLIEQINRDLPAPHGINGGSTVSLVLQLGDHVYLINAGDSQSFLAATTAVAIPADVNNKQKNDGIDATTSSTTMKTATVVLQMSVPDKPGRPDERARIEAAGGVIEQHPGDSDENARLSYYIGTAGYSLAMSRCLGDHPATGLIATPTIQVFTIQELISQATDKLRSKLLQIKTTSRDQKEEEEEEQTKHNVQPLQEQQEEICVDGDNGNNNKAGECKAPSAMAGSPFPPPPSIPMIDPKEIHLFAISATDGMMDFVHSQQIADQMGRALFLATRTGPITSFPFTAAEQLIMLSANRWHKELKGKYRDDIALAVATLHAPPDR